MHDRTAHTASLLTNGKSNGNGVGVSGKSALDRDASRNDIAHPRDDGASEALAKSPDIVLPLDAPNGGALKPRKSDTALDGFRIVVANQWHVLHSNAEGARLGADPEYVHAMRVATRRMRTALRAAQDLLQDDFADHVHRALKRLQDALGSVRDCDIALQRFDRNAERLTPIYAEALQSYRERLERQRDAARAALNAYSDSDAFTALGQHIARLLAEDGVWHCDAEGSYKRVVRKRARKVVERFIRNAGEKIHHRSPDETLHALRKDAKRARYALELLKPIGGKRVRNGIKCLKKLQDTLGAHQDAVVAQKLASEDLQALLSDNKTVPESFVGFGQLLQVDLDDARSRREAFFIAWDTSMRKEIQKRVKKAVKS